jgi:cyclopropane fatty-acyl-phospholipid synthase-like methyltransferase
MLASATYDPHVFDVQNIDQAKRIILTPNLLTTEQRWEREAPHLLELMAGLNLSAKSIVLDYGCGIGRLSKALIERYGCLVIGADISVSMRALAAAHVGSDRFFSCHPDMLDMLGVSFDAAVAVWVLQHCYDVEADIGRIEEYISGGKLFVVNDIGRCVPTDKGWVNDGVDVRAALAERFTLEAEGKMDPDIVSQRSSEVTFWAIYRCL